MIRPQRNAFRDHLELGGLWKFRADPDDVGRGQGWGAGLDTRLRIAVPGSWNEQLAEYGLMNHTGAAWLETEVHVPAAYGGRRLALYFSSAEFRADVWVNGRHAGGTDVPFLPFEIDCNELVEPGTTARIVVRVEGDVEVDGPTQRVTPADCAAEGRVRDAVHPSVRFDFFPFAGLNRPVWLTATPDAIRSVAIDTALDDGAGRVTVTVGVRSPAEAVRCRFGEVATQAVVNDGVAVARLSIPQVRAWHPDDPHLYELAVEALAGGQPIDRTTHRVGVREVRVEGTRLLLNGTPVRLRGFGKHEDAPVRGRGLDLPLLVKDFALLEWVGANSVRTSHYPYDESFLDLADERGLLVIGEVASINLDFRRTTPATLAKHKAAFEALLARDRNHPSIVMWSLANEPGYLGEPVYAERSAPYWRELFAHARDLDPSRPLTFAQVERTGLGDPGFACCDVVAINRYYGWYSEPGRLDAAVERLRADLDGLAARYGKPILVSEFGADTVAGLHATHDQLFTEEYQEALIRRYLETIEAHPASVGAHVWNFADFRTSQHFRRVVLNLKGVFTRTREPKRAAFALRELWRGRAGGGG